MAGRKIDITYCQAVSREELEQILALQRANLPENLSPSIRNSEGFLTARHTKALLKRMNQAYAHTLAKVNGRVVGYALSMTVGFRDELEVLKPMFEQIDETYGGKSFIVMGQICIDKDFRKQGIFRGLYRAMQTFTKPYFQSIITEVDIENHRSLHAHLAVGFRTLESYTSNGREWVLLVL